MTVPKGWALGPSAALAAWALADAALGRVPGWPELLGLVGLGALLVWAAADPAAQGFVRVRTRGSRERNEVALTFDDGPDPATTPAVLDTLARHGVRATFFVIGEKADAHPELVRRIRDAGHEVENHGYHHRWTMLLTPGRVRRLVDEGQASIARRAGIQPRYFRPPYGVTTPALGSVFRRGGPELVAWSLRARDATGRADPAKRLAYLLRRARSGDIILLHDAPERPGARPPLGPMILPALLEGLSARGLTPVVLSTLLEEQASHVRCS